jgi:hypothetical protein
MSETVADVFYRAEPHPQEPKLAADNHGLIYPPEEAFAPHACVAERAVPAAVQRPLSLGCITVAVGPSLCKTARPCSSWWSRPHDRPRNSALHGAANGRKGALASRRSGTDGNAPSVVVIIREALDAAVAS